MSAAIAFVVPADRLATIGRVLGALRQQTIAAGVEVVIVCEDENALGLGGAETEGLGLVRIVEVPGLVPLREAFAAGVRTATAPIVVIGETHAFPEPEALERQLAVFGEPGGEAIAAVVPALANANPATASSWASLMVTYGRSLGGARRDVATASTHSTAYRREALAACEPELPELLELGGGLDARLRAQSHRLVYEPASVYAHLNVVPLRSCFLERFHSSRIYAAGRSRHWSRPRRLAYAAASPLVPALLGSRVVRSGGWAEHRSHMPPRVYGPLAVSLVGMALGEAAAYLGGAGRAPRSVAEYELHRERYA